MARQSKKRGGGHAPFVPAVVQSVTEFSLVLGDYNNVTATWSVVLASGDRATLTGWIWVSKSGGPFERVQSLSVASHWDNEACPDINTYLMGGGQEVQAYAEMRAEQGELLVRSDVFSGTYSIS